MLVLLEMLIYLKHGYYYYVSIIIQNLKKNKNSYLQAKFILLVLRFLSPQMFC